MAHLLFLGIGPSLRRHRLFPASEVPKMSKHHKIRRIKSVLWPPPPRSTQPAAAWSVDSPALGLFYSLKHCIL